MKRNKSFFAVLAITLVTSIVATLLIASNKLKTNEVSVVSREVPIAKVQPTSPPENLENLGVVLLGYGGPGHSGGYLTDVIQLLHFDFLTNEFVVVSIPRDLWVQLPSGKSGKVNMAFTLGDDKKDLVGSGGQVSKDMVSAITGFPIHYFIAVDFVGFQRLVGEVLNGIEVDVSEPLVDSWYPIRGKEQEPCGMTPEEIADVSTNYSGFELEKQFPCRYEQLNFQPGLTKMEGGDALKYVRSRHGSSGGDFSRSKRQQELLTAMKEKLFTLDALQKAPEFFKEMKYTISTDIDLNIIDKIAPLFQNFDDFCRADINISTDNILVNSKSQSGQYILVPKDGNNSWSGVHSYLQQELKNKCSD